MAYARHDPPASLPKGGGTRSQQVTAIPAHLCVAQDFIPPALRKQMPLPVFARVPDGFIQRKVDPDNIYRTIPSDDPGDRVMVAGLLFGSFTVSDAEMNFFRSATTRRLRRLEGRIAGGTHPVTYVKAEEALAYCDWLTQLLHDANVSMTVRLPSEMELEYLMRAGREGEDIAGTASTRVEPGQAHYGQDRITGAPLPVDSPSIPALQFGTSYFYHVAGNTWEWTATTGHRHDINCGYRAVRGGGYQDEPQILRASVRVPAASFLDRSGQISFRVVAEEDAQTG